uniref:Uncharacterized protein n=1 Tax=Panagrolaimus sp. ES5 TaxID=591445 RepID=A0AC34G7N1_9BILA
MVPSEVTPVNASTCKDIFLLINDGGNPGHVFCKPGDIISKVLNIENVQNVTIYHKSGVVPPTSTVDNFSPVSWLSIHYKKRGGNKEIIELQTTKFGDSSTSKSDNIDDRYSNINLNQNYIYSNFTQSLGHSDSKILNKDKKICKK